MILRILLAALLLGAAPATAADGPTFGTALRVFEAGTKKCTRTALNFVSGTTCVDNASQARCDCTVTSGVGMCGDAYTVVSDGTTSATASGCASEMDLLGTAPIGVSCANGAPDACTWTCAAASGSQAGCLASADWTTFNGKVGTARTLTAGAGLTGGGDLSADRTFDVGAGSCITANANDVAVTAACVDAATLGGQASAFYRDAGNLNAGVVAGARGGLGVAQPSCGVNARLTCNATTCSCSTVAPLASAFVTIGSDATLTGERSLVGGAGLALTDGGANSTATLATASGEADFLASGALVCGAAAQGKAQVHTTPLQYCDNAATPALQYAAYGSSTGVATSATALAANGANCSAGAFPLGVDASGAAESCSTSISGNAATATALAANGANCSAGSFPLGVDASGAAESCTVAAFTMDADTGSNESVAPGDTFTVTGAAGITTDGGSPDTVAISTASGETDFLANGALTCGAGTRGRMRVHTTPLQYCDGAGTPALQYAAYGSSTGVATSATALAANGANCSAGNYPLGVDASGAVETCTADDDVPEAGDFGALALTGDVASVGLATTVQANAVALGTDTTGNYADGNAEAGAALTALDFLSAAGTSAFDEVNLRLGIGTATPGFTFHGKAAGAAIRAESTTAANPSFSLIHPGGGTPKAFSIDLDVNGDIHFADTGNTRLTLENGGNVGFGVSMSNPAETIDAAGNAQVTGQFKSTQATGTAPLVVASTTKVTNLNVDSLDGRDEAEFALLAGRTGGQVLRGGLSITDHLDLRPSAANDYGGSIKACGGTLTTPSGASRTCLSLFPDGLTHNFGTDHLIAVAMGTTVTVTGAGSLGNVRLFSDTNTYIPDVGTSASFPNVYSLYATPTMSSNVSETTATSRTAGLYSALRCDAQYATGGRVTQTNYYGHIASLGSFARGCSVTSAYLGGDAASAEESSAVNGVIRNVWGWHVTDRTMFDASATGLVRGFHAFGAVGMDVVVPDTPAAPTSAAFSAGGSIAAGTYSWKVTCANDAGEGNISAASANQTAGSPNFTEVLTLPTCAGATTRRRHVYRTLVGGATYFYVGQVANNTPGATFTDTIADASLTGGVVASNTVPASDGAFGVESTSPTRFYFKSDNETVWRMGHSDWTSHCTAMATAFATAEQFCPPYTTAAEAAAIATVDEIGPGALKIYALACAVNAAPATTSVHTFRVYVNGAATALSCTITGAATSCTSRAENGIAAAVTQPIAIGSDVTVANAAAGSTDGVCTMWWNLDAF